MSNFNVDLRILLKWFIKSNNVFDYVVSHNLLNVQKFNISPMVELVGLPKKDLRIDLDFGKVICCCSLKCWGIFFYNIHLYEDKDILYS